MMGYDTALVNGVGVGKTLTCGRKNKASGYALQTTNNIRSEMSELIPTPDLGNHSVSRVIWVSCRTPSQGYAIRTPSLFYRYQETRTLARNGALER